MYHCDKRGKGIHIRGGRLVNVLLRSDSSYERMLAKCVEEIFPEEDKDKFDFYIADSIGAEVWNGDKITVVKGPHRKNMYGRWDSIFKLTRIKYPSKAKFFCVKKEKSDKLSLFRKLIMPLSLYTGDTGACSNSEGTAAMDALGKVNSPYLTQFVMF